MEQHTKMPICKHFSKGYCKYGKECKFLHKKLKVRNTVDFTPLDRPVDMRIVVDSNTDELQTSMKNLDVLLVPNIFKDFKNYDIYNKLTTEIETCGIDKEELLKLWHGDNKNIKGTHYIANDRTEWKDKCPTFKMVVDRLCKYFNVEPKSTRFNWYQNANEWKPMHHDASKLKPHIAKKQNITIAVSFGQTRDVMFQHHKYENVYLSTPSKDGECYAFTHDINCTWKHGIYPGVKEDMDKRVSIIVWGWKNDLS